MTRLDKHLCARMSPAVSRHVYQTSCPPLRTRSPCWSSVEGQISTLAPVIADIVNLSITTGVFPSAFKEALVPPLLKKARPTQTISKTIVKCQTCLLSKKSLRKLSDNGLYEQMQSAYRPHHNTETALLRVYNDLCILGQRKAAILMLLDLSAALNTIDHGIMLTRHRYCFGITGLSHKWFKSYLASRSQNIQVPAELERKIQSLSGPRKCSVRWCSLLTLHLLVIIARRHGVNIQLYADDTQLYITFSSLSEKKHNPGYEAHTSLCLWDTRMDAHELTQAKCW